MSLHTYESKKSSTKQTITMKKLKDSQAPKRPVTSFLAFSAAERAKVKEELGTQAELEVARELGRRWGLLGAEQKAVYENTFKEAKEKYNEKMKSYQPSKEFLQLKAELEVKASTVSEKSGRSVKDYFAFLQSSWQEVHIFSPSLSPKEIQDTIWLRWNSEITTQTPPKASKKLKKICDPLAPKKPLSAYFLFCNSEKIKVTAKMPKIQPKEMMAELGRRWGLMEETARAPFLARAEVLKAEYQVTLQKYTQARTVGLASADGTADAKTKEVEENNEDMIVGREAADETDESKKRELEENNEAKTVDLPAADKSTDAKIREVEKNNEDMIVGQDAADETDDAKKKELEEKNDAKIVNLAAGDKSADALTREKEKNSGV